MKQCLVIALVLAVGFGLGYLFFGSRFRDPRRAEPGSPPRAASGASDDARGWRGRAILRRRGTAGGSGGAALRSIRKRNLDLVEEVKRLRNRLSEVEQDLLFATGRPEPWPRDAPARFTREAVVRAVNRALGQIGLEGEVTDVECKEFPCVVSGRLEGQVGAARFKRVLVSQALGAYGDDHAQTSITNRSGHDSLGRPWVRSHFAMALMPAGPAGTDPDTKRIVYRLRQILDASTGQ